MELPKSVKFILNKLYENEYEGYVVGGCVRDMLLNKTPKDWDICTNAKPDQIMQVFKGFNIIPTGLQHGTVTVVIDKIGYEITTYRIDGDYSDGRHPDNVKFTPELCEDLARRDFTINAMAYSEEEGIVDLYNGVEDLQKRVIRCVGNPEERFSEDALRIMRAMRFASVLDFKIEDKTDKAMKKLYENLGKVSKERINAELSKLLLGKGSKKVLKKYDYILGYIIPDVKNMIGFVQNNPHHCYDVYEHTVEVVDNVKEADLPLKLAALLHDIGKPLVYTVDDKGIGHFKGHAKKSGELAEKILKDLKYSNEIIRETLLLIVYHDFNVSLTNSFIRRMLNKLGPKTFNKLLVLRKADIDGQSEYKKEEKLKEVEDLKNLYKDFKLEDECFNLKQLKINGKDLINLGIPSGREMGDILKDIFQKVMDGHLENDEYTLTSYVKGKYLDMGNKKRLIEIAEETIQISEKGSYQIGPRIYTFDTTNNTKLFENLDDVISKVKQKQAISQKAKIEIRNEGTVDAVLRLAKGKNLELGVLNFASAHNPGGGFVYGAIAQEECIAYCSDLYTKQITGEGKKYYSINANCKTPAYTDTMFMSNVTFFRRGDYSFTPTPTMCNVLTCPAVNMGALRNRPNFDFETAKKIMKDRMRKIIYLFAYYGCKDLVLGAYGCGVFGNSPEDVAQDWYDILIEEGMEKYFNSVTFSIIDSPNRVSNIDVFKNVFKI